MQGLASLVDIIGPITGLSARWGHTNGVCLAGAWLLGQLVGQAYERREIQLFWTQAAIDTRCLDGLAVEQPFKGVAKGLATLVEGLAHDAF